MEAQLFPDSETGVPVTIVRVSSEDRNGNPLVDRLSGDRQKAISLYLPWEGFRFSKYGITTYLRENQIPQDLKSGDTRYCRVIRQSIRTKDMFTKDGQLDGSEQWHWDYSIAEWDVDKESTLPVAEQPVATPPSQQPANQKSTNQKSVSTDYKPRIDETQMRIMRQSCLGYASNLSQLLPDENFEDVIRVTVQVAELLLSYVITGKTLNDETIEKALRVVRAQEAQDVGDTNDIDEEWN
tara:strand:- start:245 stop:961 length:717 start_codon:yes stop_codon:yes gene_type:complete